MEKIAKKLTDLVGNTPLLELSNYNKSNDLKARLIVKIESFNPAGSVKDRIALAMVGCGNQRSIAAGIYHYRADKWKYRSGIGICCSRKRV